jgi:DNA (cytosine-5)-methyltransferase 1
MRLLDLFCGAGGAAMGYHRAGFEIVGVDIKPQKHYPFEFHQADAFEYLAAHADEFDVIHASPPCEAYSRANHVHHREYPRLIEPVRELLAGRPYVIENVAGAPLRNPVVPCGMMFGLKVYRHRLFECSSFFLAPPHEPHNDRSQWRPGHGPTDNGFVSIFGHGAGRGWQEFGLRYADYARQAMDCPWMTKAELAQAIPPAYTEWIGLQLLQYRCT